MDATGERCRVFFALWPDDPVRDALDDCARRLDGAGKRAEKSGLHLTLVFPGVIDATLLPALRRGATDVARQSDAFHLRLDRVGDFPRAGVRWIGPSQSPDALPRLAAALAHMCRDNGLELQQRRFQPHVTLYRNTAAAAPKPQLPSIDWWVRGFVLVESGSCGRPGSYHLRGRWPLGASPSLPLRHCR